MHRSSLLLVTAVGLTACGRDFTLPERLPLRVDPVFTRVAPTEAVTLNATGGAGGYTFAFAEGGRLSGEDATIDPMSGRYVAGSDGGAEDRIDVRDAGGAVVQVRIAVGPRLTVLPAGTIAAPAERVVFTLSGGKPPYAGTLSSNASGASLEQVDEVSFAYVAGTPAGGGGEDRLDFSDALGVAVEARVRVGAALALFGPSTAAPGETLRLIAVGGRPPYEFGVVQSESGGAFLDPLAGVYQVGSEGGGTDTLQVTDVLGQEATFALVIEPSLELSTLPLVHAGEATTLQVRGGRPPYTFAFAPRGNRSMGTLDPASGVYVPGHAGPVRDLVTVTDSVGATLQVPLSIEVGPARYPVGPVQRCLGVDLDGDGADAFIATDPRAMQKGLVVDFARSAGRTGAVDGASLGLPPLWSLLGADFDGDGREDLAVRTQQGRLVFFFGMPNDDLTPGPEFDLGALQHYALALGPAATSTHGRALWIVAEGDVCPSGRGIVEVRLSLRRMPGAAVVSCLVDGETPERLASGDFNGDGALDLASVSSAAPTSVQVRWGPGFTNQSSTDFGDGGQYLFDVFVPGALDFYALDTDGDGADDLLQLVRDGATQEQAFLQLLRGTPGAKGALDPTPPVEAGIGTEAMIRFRPIQSGIRATRILGWSLWGQHIFEFEVDASSRTVQASAETLPARSGSILCVSGGDFDGDGSQDVVWVDEAGDATYLPGDVLGGLWDHARYRTNDVCPLGYGRCSVGDLDGDGATDLLLKGAGRVQTWFGQVGAFGLGPGSLLDLGARHLWSADLDADGAIDLLIERYDQSWWWRPGAGDGTFGSAAPLRLEGAREAESWYVPRAYASDQGPLILLKLTVDTASRWFLVQAVDPARGTITGLHLDLPSPAGSRGCDAQGVDLDGDGLVEVLAVCQVDSAGVPAGVEVFRSDLTWQNGQLSASAWSGPRTHIDLGWDVGVSAVAVDGVRSTWLLRAYSSSGGGGDRLLVLSGTSSSLIPFDPAGERSFFLEIDGQAPRELVVARWTQVSTEAYRIDATGTLVPVSGVLLPPGATEALDVPGTSKQAVLVHTFGQKGILATYANDGTGKFTK